MSEWRHGRCGPNCFHPDCDCKPEWFGLNRQEMEADMIRPSMLSHVAWVALGQLAKESPYGGGWYDGDLVTKSGRDELVRAGLAERVRGYGTDLMVNRLTDQGALLAATFADPGHA